MSKKLPVIAIIPARGNSKRLKNKNIKNFMGKPLIYWTIKQSLAVKLIDRVIVSTEDIKIAKIAKSCGAEVPFMRPTKLSGDHISATDVIRNTIKKLKFNGIVVLLQPTSPLRVKKDIIKGISMINDNVQSAMSVYKFPHPSEITTLNEIGKKFSPISKTKELNIANGAVYVATSNWLLKNHTFYCEDVYTYEMSVENSIDIDDAYQFKIAEAMFKLRKINKY
tara:strand:+ start:221 stop:889 length:669 start_codon:yes stop_codon:yes gene_type:complete